MPPANSCSLSVSARGLRPHHAPCSVSRSSHQATLRHPQQNAPHSSPVCNEFLSTNSSRSPLFQRAFGRTMLVDRRTQDIRNRGTVANDCLSQRLVEGSRAPIMPCGLDNIKSPDNIAPQVSSEHAPTAAERIGCKENAKPNDACRRDNSRTSSLQKVSTRRGTPVSESTCYVRHRRRRFNTLWRLYCR